MKNTLLGRKNVLESDLSAQGKGIEKWVELSERTFNFARYARIWFEKGSTESRRAILSCLGSHLVIKDKKLAVQLHFVFQTLFENIEKAELEIQSVLTQKDGSVQAQITNPWLVCPTLRRERDSNSRTQLRFDSLVNC